MTLARLLDTTPPSLLTTAACSGLRPAPDDRPRRALLHLSYRCEPSQSDGTRETRPISHVGESTNRPDIAPSLGGDLCPPTIQAFIAATVSPVKFSAHGAIRRPIPSRALVCLLYTS